MMFSSSFSYTFTQFLLLASTADALSSKCIMLLFFSKIGVPVAHYTAGYC